MSKIVQPFLFFLTGAALAYYGYRVVKSALEPPTETRGPDPDDPVACSYWDLYGEP